MQQTPVYAVYDEKFTITCNENVVWYYELRLFSSFSEVIGVLTIVPIFLIISGESIPEEGFASEIYYYFNKFGITDSLSTVLIFFVLALIAKALINLSNSLVIGNTFALICKNFRLKLMNSVFSAEWNYFLSQRAGTLATAIADEPEVEPKIMYRKKTEINFEELEIEGQLVAPQGAMILERKNAIFNPLIKLRTEWTQEMNSSVNEI